MTRLSVTMIVLAAMASHAHAMNWEGHDDWMADLPAAQKLKSVEGQSVRPLAPPSKTNECMHRDKIGHVPPNPYDNVLPLCSELDRPSK